MSSVLRRLFFLTLLATNVLVATAQKNVVVAVEISGLKAHPQPRLLCFSTHVYTEPSHSDNNHYWFSLFLQHDEVYILSSVVGRKDLIGIPIYLQAKQDTLTVYCDVDNEFGLQRISCSGSSLAIEQTEFFESVLTSVKWQSLVDRQIRNQDGDSIAISRLFLLKKETQENNISFYTNWLSRHLNSPFTPITLYYFMYGRLPADTINFYLQRLSDSVKSNTLFAMYLYPAIMNKISKDHFKIGSFIDNFTLNTPQGKPTSLNELRKDNFILIDFWASWCGPCRKSTPQIRSIWNKYKDRNFKIVSVSADTDDKAWEKAIKQDKMDWYHLSDLKGTDEGGLLSKYSIIAIPFYILVSPDGQVIHCADTIDDMSGKIDFFLKNGKP